MKDRKQEIREKIDILNRAAKAYYQDGIEIMPNIEYDRLYDELRELERETGIVFANSPTRNVGYEVLSELPRERHPSRMLSLDKTKSRQELVEWLGDQQGLLSWKLDGLTIVLTYENGELVKALTRGNGEIGEVITGNARVFANVPVNVPYRGRLVLRGEAIITYSEFRRINSQIGDADAKYKNPRNLCSGSVRQLDPAVTRSRNVRFIAFSLVEAENVDFGGTRSGQLEWLASQGFDVVEYRHVDKTNLPETIDRFEEQVKTNDFPSDGLVLIYDDIEYGRSLGTTAKFPRDSIAFKWEDQQEETVLRKIEWSASRTGLINPVAVFDPVELEGTTVSRASVHNISIMRELKLGIGDRIMVYKANMIIPQISENLTGSDTIEVPEVCPVCSGKTEIRSDSGVSTLYCTNPLCPAKQLKSFSHFVSRNAMNIEGLSEATLEKLISRGLVREFSDLFRLDRYRVEITEMEGFGEKSFENLTTSAERARRTTPERLLYALGIPGIGAANARLIVRAAHRNWERIQSMTIEELTAIDGVGEIMAQSYVSFFQNPEKKKILEDLLEVLILDETEETRGEVFQGMTFVITGSLEHYENRDALKAEIEKAGGKVAGSVSGKTSWLINNNVNSTSGKNRKAHELGVPIINEETVRKWIAEGEITNG
ncbi:NAD-dependent DNA ligase LigA [Hornefia butyriciproducens]|uniref:NAD-dependent DNA ligase LigA n=1 Tax=Hornefia butyriciproducens TaxID=2652293 RepID=UPI002A9129CC|nr:NAD-dependent DNA ligase LigA [Hornefia butyriciproducens]MCI7412468.1 NAD-dependent DNA ligase LigA [Clostridiales bacterium]MDY5462230.1 NAD-dependent DNA ligase LigA [Hornefia butyriciproducens]MDY6211612.1 NAD-dependent DNA ligase LigA [Hornefia butyriciproducens]